MEAKTVIKKSVVIFEVDDHGRENEFDGTKYIPQFIDFIRSLGFEIKSLHPHIPENIAIEGHEFYIDSTHASFMGSNAFTRSEAPRKKNNRYISVVKKQYPFSDTVIKVRFNEELDQNKLKKNIQEAIQFRKDWQKKIDAIKNQDRDFTIAVANHFLSQPIIKNTVDSIRIHKGDICFYMNQIGAIKIEPTGKFKQFELYKKEVNTSEDLTKLIDDFEEIGEIINGITKAIMSAISDLGLLSQEIRGWAETAYESHFYVKDMRYSE